MATENAPAGHAPAKSARGVGALLRTNRWAQLGEILVVFAVGVGIIVAARPFVGENPLAAQAVAWVANVIMMLIVWGGLRLRGQTVRDFGLTLDFQGWRRIGITVLKSVATLVAALVAFAVGAVIMANIVGIPEGSDLSGYNYLSGNLPMLIAALVAVWIVSSFGEEFIYRGFLINRFAVLGPGDNPSWKLAVLGSAIVFGLIHFEWGATGMVQTAFMGLALGVAYLIAKRNLWMTVLAHGYLDTVLFVQLYLAPPESGAG